MTGDHGAAPNQPLLWGDIFWFFSQPADSASVPKNGPLRRFTQSRPRTMLGFRLTGTPTCSSFFAHRHLHLEALSAALLAHKFFRHRLLRQALTPSPDARSRRQRGSSFQISGSMVSRHAGRRKREGLSKGVSAKVEPREGERS